MAKINLLPWREEKRKIEQREFNALLGLSLVVGLFLVVLVYLFYSGQISGQQKRNELMRQEIAAVEIKIKEIKQLDKRKEGLLSRKRVIEELQGKRFEMVSLFTDLAKTISGGTQIFTIKQSGADLIIQGRAQSSASVSSYMKSIITSPMFNTPDLAVIEARGSDRSLPYEFILNTSIKQPKPSEEQLGTEVESLEVAQ